MPAATPAKETKAKTAKCVKAPPPSVGIASMQGMVLVKVGPKSVHHHVHKALLVHHSEYFRNSLTGPWTEAQEQVINLNDVEPSTFTLFVHWLYYQEIPTSRQDWVRLSLVYDSSYWADACIHICIRAYGFGDRFVIPAFSRASNNLIAQQNPTRYYFDPLGRISIEYAFETIPLDRVILQRLVDWYCECWRATSDHFDATTLASLPDEFLRRVMGRLHESKTMTMAEVLKKCCYLEHASDEEKKECGALHMRYDQEHAIATFQ